MHNLIEDICKDVLRNLIVYNGVEEVRVFGSSLRKVKPNDLDILLIADNNIEPSDWHSLTKIIHSLNNNTNYHLPLNIILLKRVELIDPGPVLSNILLRSKCIFSSFNSYYEIS